MTILTVIVPLRYPSEHIQNVSAILKDCSGAQIQTVVVVDSVLKIEECGQDLSALQEFQPTLIVGDFGGPGVARNAGLRVAKGEWIAFWDADDQPIVGSLISNLTELSSDVDVVMGGFSVLHQNEVQESPFYTKSKTQDFILNPGIWRFVFRSRLIKGLEFTPLMLGEDQVFLAQVFTKHPKLTFMNESIYNYRVGVAGQITGSSRELIYNSQFHALRLLRSLELKHRASCNFCKMVSGLEIKLALGFLRNVGLFGTLPRYGYFKPRFMALMSAIWPISQISIYQMIFQSRKKWIK